jgi:hypothetical protein
MEGEKIFCEHFNEKNITKSVAGKKIYRDQCSKCYDDSVIKLNFLFNYFIYSVA